MYTCICIYNCTCSRRAWRYQRGNQNPYIKTMAKRIKYKRTNNDLQNRQKTKDRVTRTSLKTGGELRCSGRASSSCSASCTRRINLVTNPVISREWGKDQEVFTTNETYPWTFVTHIFHNGQQSHGRDRNIFNFTKRCPWSSSYLVSSK